MDSQLSPSFAVQSLSIHGWRNLEEVAIQPHATFNVFHGDNAQGKTNLLEAVYLVSRLKSFRDVRLGDLVTHGQPAGRVEARVRRAGVAQKVEVVVEGAVLVANAATLLPPIWISVRLFQSFVMS